MKKLMLNCFTLILGCLLVQVCPVPAADSAAKRDLVHQLNDAFAEAAAKICPSVVVITVVQKPDAAVTDDDFSSQPEEMREFWREFHKRFPKQPTTQGEGSGIIIRHDGYLLTNGHVVEDAETITVRLQDGRTFPATVRGVDTQSDVAVLKIDARDLPVAKFADSSKTRVGEFAIAVGAPYSLDYTVTFGHVSAKARSNILEPLDRAMMDQDFIQTDALINPGNSGGPLVNIDAEVIGINTLIRGLHSGIGFAIPSNLAREISDQIVTDGKFTRGWLGVGIIGLQEEPRLTNRIKGVTQGVVITRILPDGPAAKSDLRPYDVVTTVNGEHVNTPQQLRNVIRGKKLGQPVTLEVFRQEADGKSQLVKINVNPGAMPEVPLEVVYGGTPAPLKAPPKVGLTVVSMSPKAAKQAGDLPAHGVVVEQVEKGSPADLRGIKSGDIIASVNHQAVGTTKEFGDELRKADLAEGITLIVIRDGAARFEILKEKAK